MTNIRDKSWIKGVRDIVGDGGSANYREGGTGSIWSREYQPLFIVGDGGSAI